VRPADPTIVAIFARAKQTYGDWFTYSETNDPGSFLPLPQTTTR
jgi:hypothetical protein